MACRPLPPVRKSRVEHAASGTQSTPTDISDPRWIAATRRVSDAPTARAQLRVVRGPCSSGELRESQARRRPTHPISAGLLKADLDRQSKPVVTAWNYTRTVSERGSWTLPPPPIYCCEEMIGRDCRSPPWAERDRVGAGLEVLGAGLDAYLTHSYGPDWPNLLAAHDATRDLAANPMSGAIHNADCGCSPNGLPEWPRCSRSSAEWRAGYAKSAMPGPISRRSPRKSHRRSAPNGPSARRTRRRRPP